MDLNQIRSSVIDGKIDDMLIMLYGEDNLDYARERYLEAVEQFSDYFGHSDGEFYLFSSPGRTELCGNHTDHNYGKVLAGAVNIDVIAVVCKTDGNVIRVKSKGHGENKISLDELSPVKSEEGTSNAILRGVTAKIKEIGLNVGAYEAYTVSNVPAGSGVSSSAAFEALLGKITDTLYCGEKIDNVLLAKIAQYAENVYFGKPCGLMDQLTVTTGSAVKFDFCDIENPRIDKLDFDFMSSGYKLCIVNTGGSHADLTDDYASIRTEMESVAACFGKKVLREVDSDEVFSNIKTLRDKVSDRALLRAAHFYGENERVEKAAKALKNGDFKEFLKCINDSGRSSFMYNQNIYSVKNLHTQGVALGLNAAGRYLGEEGAYRVHGGGFAGTIQAFVPDDMADGFKSEMESIFGDNSCFIVSIRPCGPVKVL